MSPKKKYFVFLADIHGTSIGIEKGILGGIATLGKGERRPGTSDSRRILRTCVDADAIGVRHTRISSEVIDKLDKCRIIARFGGGYDNIDVKAATRKGIIVTFVPDYCTDAVAEHALAFALVKIRGIREAEDRIRQRFWSAQGIKAEMAKDVVLGIVGLGRIGGALSRKAAAVGFKVVAYDPFIPHSDFRARKATRMKRLGDLLEKADIVSLNVPLTKEGKHPTFQMLGKKELTSMKSGAYIINVCRGEVMDTKWLIRALKGGRLSGLVTDVIEGEPVQNSYLRSRKNPVFDTLKSLPNVTITPHSAFMSTRSVRDVKTKAAREIKSVLQGKMPRKKAWVNPEVKDRHRRKFGKKG